MKQEDKQLLVKDLCARLPYGVKIRVEYPFMEEKDWRPEDLYGLDLRRQLIAGTSIRIEEFKPYLRPMSSMTEEEKEDLKSKCTHTETEKDWEGIRSDRWGIQILEKYDTRNCDNPIWTSTINMDAIDWLNKNHFDYRGLIEKGLAIDATNLNIY